MKNPAVQSWAQLDKFLDASQLQEYGFRNEVAGSPLSLGNQSFLQLFLGWSLQRQPGFGKPSCGEATLWGFVQDGPLESVKVESP